MTVTETKMSSLMELAMSHSRQSGRLTDLKILLIEEAFDAYKDTSSCREAMKRHEAELGRTAEWQAVMDIMKEAVEHHTDNMESISRVQKHLDNKIRLINEDYERQCSALFANTGSAATAAVAGAANIQPTKPLSAVSWTKCPNPKNFQFTVSHLPGFPTVVPDGADWVEVACGECGQNFSLHTNEMFKGVKGLWSHLHNVHDDVAFGKWEEFIRRRCILRRLTKIEVEILLNGGQLDVPIQKKHSLPVSDS